MNGHHIRLNTSCKHKKKKNILSTATTSDSTHHLNTRKEKAYIMNGHDISLNTSSKQKKGKTIYYEGSPHRIEYII